MLAGAMEELGRKPDECEFIETWSFNSNKCFAVFRPDDKETDVSDTTLARRAPSPAVATDPARPGNGAIPKLNGDIRPLIPKLGLRNYWYPATLDAKVGSRKPVKVVAARRGDLPLPRRERRRRRHPGRLPPPRRAPQRGRLPLPRHRRLPVPRLGVRRVGQERGGAVRGPGLRRVRQAGHRGEGLPDAHAQGARVRLDRRRRPRADRAGRARGVLRRRARWS